MNKNDNTLDRVRGVSMDKINIMDLDVNAVTNEILFKQIREYCQDESVHSVLMLTDEILEKAAKDEKYHEMIAGFSMRLPAEDEVLIDCHLEFLKCGGILTDYHSFYSILHCLEKEKKTVYIVGSNLNQMEQFQVFCEQFYSSLRIVGSCYKDSSMKDEAIVNDINTILPDVVIVALKSPEQEKWMLEQGMKLGIKLCIGTGSAFADIIDCCDKKRKKMRKWKIYRQLEYAKRYIQKIWHRRIIRNEYEYYIYKRKKSQF